MSGKRTWTDEQTDYLIKHYGTVPSSEIGNHIGKTRTVVNSKAHALGLTKHHKSWDISEDEFIQNNIDKGYDWIAEQLEVNKATLVYHIHVMKEKPKKEARKSKEHFYKSREDYLDFTDISYLTGINKYDVGYWEDLGLKTFELNNKKYIEENNLIQFMRNHPDIWLCRHCEEWFFWNHKWFRDKAKKEQQDYLKWKWGIEA